MRLSHLRPLQEIVIYDGQDNCASTVFIHAHATSKGRKMDSITRTGGTKAYNLPAITGVMFLFHIPPTFHWWHVAVERKRCEC